MKIKALLIFVTAVFLYSGNIYATLFVSGDSNLSTHLNAGYGSDLDLGNRQFFTNILGSGNDVLVLNGIDSFDASINDFYNSLPDVTSQRTEDLTASVLLGVDLLFAFIPSAPFTSEEIGILDQYLTEGGSVFFGGDIEIGGLDQNLYINNTLEALGSEMRISSFDWVSGSLTATGSNIAEDPFTAGVETFSYAAEYEVLGGTPLFFSTITDQSNAFVAYETTASVPAPVPEPTTMLLLGTGLVGLAGVGRKKLFKK